MDYHIRYCMRTRIRFTTVHLQPPQPILWWFRLLVAWESKYGLLRVRRRRRESETKKTLVRVRLLTPSRIEPEAQSLQVYL